jgi:tetratricopeptide (TPR) repeat protein
VFLGRFRELIERLAEQREHLDALADPALAGPFYFWWGFACTLLAERSEGEQHARTALEHAQRAADTRSVGYAHTLLSYLCAVTGRCEEGLRHGGIAIEVLGRTTLEPDALTLAFLHQGLNYLWLGDWPEALAAVQRAQAVADASESQRGRALAATSLAYGYGYVHEWPLAIEAARRGLDASSEPITLAHAMWISGYAQAGGGEPHKAAAQLEVVIAQLEHHGMRAQSGHARVALAGALLRVGEAGRALSILVDALEISRSVGDLPGLGAGLRVRGQAELRLRQWAQARASLDEAQAVFQSCHSRIDLANTFVVQAELAHATGDRGAERGTLVRARTLYLECGAHVAAAQLPAAEDQGPPQVASARETV